MRQTRDLLAGLDRSEERDFRARVADLEDKVFGSILPRRVIHEEAVDFRALDPNTGEVRMIMSAISLLEEFGVKGYFLGRDESGQPTVWIDADTGAITAALGEWWVDGEGTHSEGMTFLHKFNAVYGGFTRQAFIGMYLPDGADRPSLRIYYNEPSSGNLFTNGSFEAGDETDWTDTNTSYTVAADATYGYAATHDPTDTGCPPTLTRSVAVTANKVYGFIFASKLLSGVFPCNATLTWKDAGSAVLRTDTLIGGSTTTYQEKSAVYTSPTGAATVLLTVHAGDIFSESVVSGFELYELTSFSSIDFYDEKILINALPGKPANLFGAWAEQASMDLHNIYTVVTGFSETIDTSQAYGFYMSASAGNSNDADEYYISFEIAAGTYTFSLLGRTGASAGKTDCYLDNEAAAFVSGMDWYSIGTTRNVTKTGTVTIPVSGRHYIKIKVNGKNAASTDYQVNFTMAFLKKTTAPTKEA